MRIKIKGEITAERLAEALHAAAEKYEAVRPGHKVYGANLGFREQWNQKPT
nr:hypothetical protein PGH06_25715 [Citrobacter braakii]